MIVCDRAQTHTRLISRAGYRERVYRQSSNVLQTYGAEGKHTRKDRRQFKGGGGGERFRASLRDLGRIIYIFYSNLFFFVI